jgi:hypothetical protein
MKRALTVSLFLALAAPAFAHHTATRVYDPAKLVTLTGIIADVEWKQPHVMLHLDVKAEDGTLVRWDVEAQNPNAVRRNGVQQDAVRPGTTVTSKGCLARDGSHKTYAQTIVIDGTEFHNGGCR